MRKLHKSIPNHSSILSKVSKPPSADEVEAISELTEVDVSLLEPDPEEDTKPWVIGINHEVDACVNPASPDDVGCGELGSLGGSVDVADDREVDEAG